MRECPWCGRMNLNVYAYCHGCGRGFGDLEPRSSGGAFSDTNMGMWLAGTSPSAGLPAFWPVVGALAALVFGGALLWAQASDDRMAAPMVGASAAVLAIAAVAWMAASSAGAKVASAAQTTTVRNIQVALVDAADVARANDLRRWLKNPRELLGLREVVRVETSAGARGQTPQTLIRLELAGETGPDRAELERIVRAHAGNDARVELFPPQAVPETREQRVRMGTTAAATLVGGLLIGGVALAAAYAALSDGGGEGPVGPTGPTGFPGTIVARNTKFVETAFSLPPNTEVTLKLDNRDPSPPHNIQFFAGPDTSGALLTGCTAGCPTVDVSTAIATGPVVEEFTFTTPGPGDYAYNCIVHPVEMRGTMTIAEGAPPPTS